MIEVRTSERSRSAVAEWATSLGLVAVSERSEGVSLYVMFERK